MNKVVATTLEAKFSVYDLRTQHPTKGFTSLTEKAGVNYDVGFLPVCAVNCCSGSL